MIKKVIRQIKIVIHSILLNTVDWFAKKKAIIQQNKLLIIRLDAIGDYILFRNFLQVFRENKKFTEYSITLIGNEAWKELAEVLDKSLIDNFIWLNRNKFYKNYYYRFKKIREISSVGYSVVVNPMYSREPYFSEAIIKVLTANEKVACLGDTSNISKSSKRLADRCYTKLLANDPEVLFEFYRNQEFFENLLKVKLQVELLIDSDKVPFIDGLSDKFIVLFLGASHSYRQWSIENFAHVGKYLKEKFGFEIVICGSKSDINQAKWFKILFNDSFIDLVGKTSLIELLAVIKQSQLIISNETSAVHFAAALGGIPIFVLYNGRHFGRFVPYPKQLCDNYNLICHPEIEKNKLQYQQISNNEDYINKLSINDISVDDVINVINNYLINMDYNQN